MKPKQTKPKGERVWVVKHKDAGLLLGLTRKSEASARVAAAMVLANPARATIQRATLIMDEPKRRAK